MARDWQVSILSKSRDTRRLKLEIAELAMTEISLDIFTLVFIFHKSNDHNQLITNMKAKPVMVNNNNKYNMPLRMLFGSRNQIDLRVPIGDISQPHYP